MVVFWPPFSAWVLDACEILYEYTYKKIFSLFIMRFKICIIDWELCYSKITDLSLNIMNIKYFRNIVFNIGIIVKLRLYQKNQYFSILLYTEILSTVVYSYTILYLYSLQLKYSITFSPSYSDLVIVMTNDERFLKYEYYRTIWKSIYGKFLF